LVPVGEPLIAEVYIDNQDIGFVREGQAVRVKLAAYPFTKYGLLDGIVTNISADASRMNADQAPQAQENFTNKTPAVSPFKARVRLGNQKLVWNGTSLPVAAGMQVVAEIRQGERTVLEYLLSPVRRVGSEAGQER
jgi:hemolysin D